MLFAARNGSRELVSYLLSQGADVNCSCCWGMTPLHIATGKGDLEVVRMLIAAGADVNCPDRDKRTPLHWASCGHLEIASCLLAAGAEVNCSSLEGWTALHEASLRGDLDMVAVLVSAGAFVDAVDEEFRMTPIGMAISRKRHSAVDYFIDREQRSQLAYKEGGSLFHVACKENKLVMVVLLQKLWERRLDCSAKDVHGKQWTDYISTKCWT